MRDRETGHRAGDSLNLLPNAAKKFLSVSHPE